MLKTLRVFAEDKYWMSHKILPKKFLSTSKPLQNIGLEKA